MRHILKAAFKRDFRDVQLRAAQQRGGIIQPLLQQPFARRLLKVLLKIALERGQAAVTQLRVFFQRQIETKIRLHDLRHRCTMPEGVADMRPESRQIEVGGRCIDWRKNLTNRALENFGLICAYFFL